MKDDFLKKIIIALGVFLLTFTVAILIVFIATGGAEPSTLIACVFAACLGECSICGLIKTSKEKNKKEEEKINYKEYQPVDDEDDINIAG